jgi:hypothetical protein
METINVLSEEAARLLMKILRKNTSSDKWAVLLYAKYSDAISSIFVAGSS